MPEGNLAQLVLCGEIVGHYAAIWRNDGVHDTLNKPLIDYDATPESCREEAEEVDPNPAPNTLTRPAPGHHVPTRSLWPTYSSRGSLRRIHSRSPAMTATAATARTK